MADIFWLEQRQSDVPAGSDWLAPEELERQRTFHIPKRRADWRLGRWTAKLALARAYALPEDPSSLAAIVIVADSTGAPRALLSGIPTSGAISISHSDGRALCAVCLSGSRLGCDLEVVEPRSDVFLADYFTPPEQQMVAKAAPPRRDLLVTLLWSAKETALKALHEGLRLDTRSVSVSLSGFPPEHPEQWNAYTVCTASGQAFSGWWRLSDNMICAVASASSPSPPIDLRTWPPARGRTDEAVLADTASA